MKVGLLASGWDKFLEGVKNVNDFIHGIVWGWPMIILILGTGILLTILTKFLQIRKFGMSVDETLGNTVRSMRKKNEKVQKKEKAISPFEAFATAISGTVGTGNIVGVTSAIMTGGPGAVVWMWISAFFGMVTNYSENVLGMYFRKREKDGEFSGGPAYYLAEGVGRGVKGKWGIFLRGLGKTLAVLAAVFCTFAAIGMSGVQTNKMSATIQGAIGSSNEKTNTIIAIVVGVVVAILLALVILGGIKSIGRTTAILVPFMSLIFIVMALVIIFVNIGMVGNAFSLIFGNMFKIRSAVAGVGGYMIAQITQKGIMLIVQKGLARGIFSNEAGLGSSVIAHSASETREPVKQGFWGIFEVFFDTFIICTLTALVVLVSFGDEAGMTNVLYATQTLKDGSIDYLYSDTTVSMMAFVGVFGVFGKIVYSTILPLFAFTTIVAWSYYGEKSIEFLFRKAGDKGKHIARTVFKVAYVLLVIVASLISGKLVWAISDTFNGLMALPNLIGLVIMSTLVAKLTKNYLDRKKGKDVVPMLSAYPEQNAQFIKDLKLGFVEEVVKAPMESPIEEVVEEPVVEDDGDHLREAVGDEVGDFISENSKGE